MNNRRSLSRTLPGLGARRQQRAAVQLGAARLGAAAVGAVHLVLWPGRGDRVVVVASHCST